MRVQYHMSINIFCVSCRTTDTTSICKSNYNSNCKSNWTSNWTSNCIRSDTIWKWCRMYTNFYCMYVSCGVHVLWVTQSDSNWQDIGSTNTVNKCEGTFSRVSQTTWTTSSTNSNLDWEYALNKWYCTDQYVLHYMTILFWFDVVLWLNDCMTHTWRPLNVLTNDFIASFDLTAPSTKHGSSDKFQYTGNIIYTNGLLQESITLTCGVFTCALHTCCLYIILFYLCVMYTNDSIED